MTVILTVSEESFKMNSCTIVFIEDDSWLSHYWSRCYMYMYMYSKSDIVIAALYMYVLHVCVPVMCSSAYLWLSVYHSLSSVAIWEDIWYHH